MMYKRHTSESIPNHHIDCSTEICIPAIPHMYGNEKEEEEKNWKHVRAEFIVASYQKWKVLQISYL